VRVAVIGLGAVLEDLLELLLALGSLLVRQAQPGQQQRQMAPGGLDCPGGHEGLRLFEDREHLRIGDAADAVSGNDPFTYVISDGNDGTDIGTVTVSVAMPPDTTPPLDPGIDSTVPLPGTWTTGATVAGQWSEAADELGGSGLAGYSLLFDGNAITQPDATVDVCMAPTLTRRRAARSPTGPGTSTCQPATSQETVRTRSTRETAARSVKGSTASSPAHRSSRARQGP
jgi:hypothetical protein